MLRIAICDENLADIQQLHAALKRILKEEAQISVFRSGKHFLEDPGAGLTDIVLMSVHPETGAEVRFAREINDTIPAAEIIYLFTNLHYCADIYDTRHTYALMKPVEDTRLERALERAKENLSTMRIRGVLIPMRGGVSRRVFNSDILYCERRGRETVIELKCGQAYTALRIGQLEELLPAATFARPHNSFLVNLGHVKKVENRCLTVDNGAEIPISNQKRDAFVEALREFI